VFDRTAVLGLHMPERGTEQQLDAGVDNNSDAKQQLDANINGSVAEQQ
jgi:hypothetical protein